MRRLFYTLLLMGGFCLSTYAQTPNSRQSVASASTNVSNYDLKMAALKSCPELHQQLLTLVGGMYTVSDPKVIAQLNANIENKAASACVREQSLFGIYGEDYVNHLDLIGNKKTNKKTK